MNSLMSLDDCLAAALAAVPPVAAEVVPLPAARGGVLAKGLSFPADTPPVAEALRAGLAVVALDLTGASAGLPIPLAGPVHVLPGDPLPPGTDAVLPPEGVEAIGTAFEAIRPINPGEGVRRAGHDGRAGAPIAAAGAVMSERLCLIAALAGLAECHLRRPRLLVDLPDPLQADYAGALLTGLGGQVGSDTPDLILRPALGDVPCLALAPGDTARLSREGAALVLSVPRRFDGMVMALLALGLPAMATLTGGTPVTEARPLTRKVASALGLSDLVLLTRQGADWHPGPAGTVTLAGLAAADAFAIVPPDSEGLPAGAMLAGTLLSSPFG